MFVQSDLVCCHCCFQGSSIPIVLVENGGRCNKNDDDEKVSYLPHAVCLFSYVSISSQDYWGDWLLFGSQILLNGIAWIPNLVKMIVEVALNEGRGILVDKKLIEGPNPNQRGKRFIPLILAFQVSFLTLRVAMCGIGSSLVPGPNSLFSGPTRGFILMIPTVHIVDHDV